MNWREEKRLEKALNKVDPNERKIIEIYLDAYHELVAGGRETIGRLEELLDKQNAMLDMYRGPK